MPKKACCCGGVTPTESGSCCKPIYQDCVGKNYEFTFRVKAKYPCFQIGNNTTYPEALYTCQNGTQLNIPGYSETFEINVQYQISEPAEIPDPIQPDDPNSLDCGFCHNGSPNCTQFPTNPCNCLTDATYSKCNFGASELLSDCQGNGTALCLNTDWGQCYQGYSLKNSNTSYQQIGSGCTFTHGESNIANIANSYSIQFIPDPNIPEQNLSSYVPRLQPELLTFRYNCTAPFWPSTGGPGCNPTLIFNEQDYFYSNTPVVFSPYFNGYSILIEMGFGYDHEFICGYDAGIPIIERLSIPFQITVDDFIGDTFYDGLHIVQVFNRQSLTTDPMNMCVPQSTKIYPISSNDCASGRCTEEINYRDDYTNCVFGRESIVVGTPGFGFGFPVQNVKMPDYCGSITFDPTVPYEVALHCQYVNFTNNISVARIL